MFVCFVCHLSTSNHPRSADAVLVSRYLITHTLVSFRCFSSKQFVKKCVFTSQLILWTEAVSEPLSSLLLRPDVYQTSVQNGSACCRGRHQGASLKPSADSGSAKFNEVLCHLCVHLSLCLSLFLSICLSVHLTRVGQSETPSV